MVQNRAEQGKINVSFEFLISRIALLAITSGSWTHVHGNGRWHLKDRKNFWWIARGSVFECIPLLELCKRKELINEATWAALKAELEVLSKMLTALIKGTDNR